MTFNYIAKLYRYCEWLVFGSKLQKTRCALLPDLEQWLDADSKVLLLADGDGRFLEQFITLYPDVEVDFVEHSSAMMSLAQKRVGEQHKIHWHCSDARDWQGDGYDLVISHFFLDCFTAEELNTLVPHLVKQMRPKACWLISDFSSTPGLWAKALISIMYLFFKIVTRLCTHSLIDPAPILEQNGLECLKESRFMGKLTYSKVWVFSKNS